MTLRTVIEVARRGRDGDYTGSADVSALTTRVSTVERYATGVQSVNLRSEGFALDGTTNETARFQALLDSVPDNTQIVLDERANLRISGQVSAIGKTFRIVGRGDATITVTTKLAVPAIVVTSAPGVQISGIRIVGAESTFDGVFDTQAFAISLVSCHNAVVQNCSAQNISRGLNISNSDNVSVDGWSYFGMVSTAGTNVNFNSGIRLMNSHGAKLSRIYAENCGSCLLVGSTSERGQVSMASGRNTFDNGIYVSSGNGWEIVGPNFSFDTSYTGDRGTGVKMRGSDNTLLGGTFTRMGVGAIITGTGGTPMADGYDGRGSRIIGAKAIDPYNVGFSIEAVASAACRDGLIMGCYVEGHGLSGSTSASAIRVLTGKGHQVAYNTILPNSNSASVVSHLIASGASGAPVTGIQVVGNTIRNAGGTTAISAAYVNRARIVNNTLENITATYGIRLIESFASEVTGNYAIGAVGGTEGIRVNDATSANNNVYRNSNMTISDAGTDTLKFGNATGNPTVAASATDLASAIALVNDIKTKLQAQRVLG